MRRYGIKCPSGSTDIDCQAVPSVKESRLGDGNAWFKSWLGCSLGGPWAHDRSCHSVLTCVMGKRNRGSHMGLLQR